MELLTILTAAIAAETSYLVYRSARVPRTSSPKLLLDTSVLIDGRIVSIARSGFITSELIVIKSVVRELQYMADKADHDKRERARFGLDTIQALQAIDEIKVTVYDDGALGTGGVDEQLIIMSKKLGAALCTTDYNLNKVARVESIVVANINELSHALRPSYLPGEKLTITIVQAGQNRDQGVGYLDDGTMVVVDNAKTYIGQNQEVEAVRMLQTEAGKMLFARLVKGPRQATEARQPRQQAPRVDAAVAPTAPAVRVSRGRSQPQQSAQAEPEDSLVVQTPPQANVRDTARPSSTSRRRSRRTPEDSLLQLVNQADSQVESPAASAATADESRPAPRRRYRNRSRTGGGTSPTPPAAN
jgi:rRNA-processing protein FCF1